MIFEIVMTQVTQHLQVKDMDPTLYAFLLKFIWFFFLMVSLLGFVYGEYPRFGDKQRLYKIWALQGIFTVAYAYTNNIGLLSEGCLVVFVLVL